MTKKKFLAALSTAAITTSLLATTALAGTTQTIEWNNNGGTAEGNGSGSVRVPVIEVEVPLDLPFAMNPYKLNLAEEGADAITDQIWSDNYMICNYSEVPVAVATSSTAKGKDADSNGKGGLALETTVTVDPNTKKYVGSSANAEKKNAFIGMQFAKEIEFTEADGYKPKYGDKVIFGDGTNITAATGEVLIKDKTSFQEANGLLLSANAEEATFVLGTSTANGANAVAFKYIGVLNDSTTNVYADEDITVKTVYTLSVLASDDISSTTSGTPAVTTTTVKGYDKVDGTAVTGNATGALNAYKKKS